MASFLPQNIIGHLTHCATQADKLAREKLNAGKVIDENDYTSNFTCLFDFAINALRLPELRSSIQRLNPTRERSLDADGCIVLQNIPDRLMKVGIFEAKWPRLNRMNYDWDYLQSDGDSHFHTQLERQEIHISYYAIWEMFYLEHSFHKQPNFMPPEGSACAWQTDIYPESEQITNPKKLNSNKPSKPWQSSDLLNMPASHFITISKVLEEICECSRGEVLSITSIESIFKTGICPEEAIIVTYLGS